MSTTNGDRGFDVAAAQEQAALLRCRIAGRRVRHYQGDIYRVVWADVDKETGAVRVSYRHLRTGETWSCTATDFNELMAVDGKFVARFELVP